MITYDLTLLNLPIGAHIIQVKAKAPGYEDSDFSNAVTYVNAPNLITADNKYLKDSQGKYLNVLDPAEYTITANVTNGSATGASTIVQYDTAQVTIVPDTGYVVPDTISISGADVVYTNGVATLSNATGNVTITATCPAEVVVVKGQIITMNVDGTDKQFRVIKIVDGSVVEVVGMTDATSIAFDNGNTPTYEDKTLDTYLNSTWYNTLSSTAKSAIVDKTFRQDKWYSDTSGNPVYQGKRKFNGDKPYQVSLANASFGNEITRHAYAISVQDVIDYLEVTPEMTQANTTLTYNNVWTMFWNSTTTHSGDIWLRSADATGVILAFFVSGSYGRLSSSGASTSYVVRPAFQIDLSKISWS